LAKKKVSFVLKSNPFSWKAFESLRQAVGLSMEHEVYFICMKDGVYTLTDWKPQMLGIDPIDKSVEALGMMDGKIVAEEEAVRERGIMLKKFPVEIEIKSKEEITEIIQDSEVVITW